MQLPDIASLNIDKSSVLALAAMALPSIYTTNHDPAYRARLSATRAYREHATVALAGMISQQLSDLYRSHEIVNEPRDEIDETYQATWDESLSFAIEQDLSQIREMIGSDVFEELAGSEVGYHQVGRIEEIAAELAKCVTRHYINVPDDSAGKFLSKIGIGARDLKAIIALAKATPLPDKPAPENEDDDGAAEPVPEEEELPAAASGNGSGTPSKQELSEAFQAWAAASGPDFADFAKRLDISGGTVRNYSNGKTLPKLTVAQAAVMAQDCDDCIGKLSRAFKVFSRMRLHNGSAA